MAYTTKTDVANAAGGVQKLVEVADLDGQGDIVAIDAAIAAAQAAADGWIDSYAQKRFAVPFLPVPAIVRELAAKETVYRLIQGRRMVGNDERSDHEERERWLELLSKGLVSPGTDPEPANSLNVTPAIIQRSSDENISRETLELW